MTFDKKYDVFISYAREDIVYARKIFDELKQAGIRAWLDERRLEVGERWKATIRKEIDNSKYFLAILSTRSISKHGFVQKEIEQAIVLQQEKYVQDIYFLPLRIDECEIIYPELRCLNVIDIFPDYEKGIACLIQTIWKDKSQSNLEVVGFDLGHGETAISTTNILSSSEPKIIDIAGNSSIITAVAITAEGVIIGDDAYDYESSDELFILFKSYKLDDPNVREPVKLFVSKLLEILSSQKKIRSLDNTWFFVGSPSGWTDYDRKQYEQLLREAGMLNVTVRRESRAAFLDARESGILSSSFAQISDSVLIIDIGSSTTDFTLVKDYREIPLDFGHNQLGGSLIDILIFGKAMDSLSATKRNEINRYFNSNHSLKSKCILKCREVKEKYFSKLDLDNNYWDERPVRGILVLDEDSETIFTIKLYKKDIDEILDGFIHELKASWVEAFRTELRKCKDSPYYQNVKLILMTGGGSRMPFTYDVCQEEFPQTEILRGLDPKLTISKGLAILGRTDFKINSFRAEVDEFIESQTLNELISQQLPILVDSVTKLILDKYFDISFRNFMEWCDCKVPTLRKMQDLILSETKRYFNDGEGCLDIEKETTRWLLNISRDIENLTFPLCEKYQISRATFCLDLQEKTPNILVPSLDLTAAARRVIIGSISFTAIIVFLFLLPSPLTGLPVATTALTVTFLTIGKPILKAIFKDVLDYNFPKGIRKALISEQSFSVEINKGRHEFENSIRNEIEDIYKSEAKTHEIVAYIKRELYIKADEAAIIIRSIESRKNMLSNS